jgi:pSer/pThr/pTyr-binding forkhead associated (FHA) protein
MQVILKPLSDPGLDEIIISDCLFAIGRYEAPFASYDKELVANLSRRHARIFEEGDSVYVVDLGSRNGTRLNGGAVGQTPEPLRRGDRIGLAGKLEYEVEILGQAAVKDPSTYHPPDLCLTLVPARDHAEIEPIVVSRFPFLISKSDEVFARYKERFPKQVDYISRRHAHVFLKEGRPYLEDLGSTNGTYVDGKRLEEEARALQEGDRVAFGSEYFSYLVRIEKEHSVVPAGRTEGVGATVIKPKDATEYSKTTFVTTANSFLDIFCAQDEDPDTDGAAAGPGSGQGDKAAGDAAQARPGRPGILGRARVFVRELRGSVSEEGATPRRRWPYAVVALLAVGLAAGVYLSGTQHREIKALIEAGEYARGAELATRYLQGHPDDEQVRAWATEALMKDVVPQWMASVQDQDFDAAGEVLNRAQALAGHDPEARELLGMLGWMGRLERFVAERGGMEAPIVIYRDEGRIEALIDWWESDPGGRRNALGRVLALVPEFKDTQVQALSHLRRLRSSSAVNLAAIEKLKATLAERLKSGQIEGLGAELQAFEARYPGVGGLDRLRAEWQAYLAVRRAVEAQNLMAAIKLSRKAMEIEPFREAVAKLRETKLPPTEIAQGFDEARQAWGAGETGRALQRLDGLRQGPWGELAERQWQRKRRVAEDFEALKGIRATPQYPERLLEFYARLSPEEDRFFIQALKKDYRAYRDRALARAEQAFRRAEQSWKDYRGDGGINGLHRLEAKVSPRFKEQARRLTEAYNQAREGAQLYDLLDQSYGPKWGELYGEIQAETALQRRSLQELSMVLNPTLLDAKLGLLAVPQPAGGAP